MKRLAIGTLKHTAKALGYGLAGGLAVLLVVAIYFLNNKPGLKVWHQADLDAEFKADGAVRTLEDYLALEDRLFRQLQERVCDRIEPQDRTSINRFHRGSLSDPGRWEQDWNRTFELKTAAPKAGVLLLHGLSDSPYSLRALGTRLHAEGVWITGLRIPGHGTAPSGLVDTTWEDMAAAVRIAAAHVRKRVGDRPLYIVGYSNGGALAVNYVISTLRDPELPKIDGMVLISPEIGITPMARFAIWQERIGDLLGLRKLRWNSVLPEYDPFKYNSFPANAGDLAYRLTIEIRSQLASLSAAGELEHFPPVIAFQSVVDSTVSAPALVQDLFERLPRGRHELVLFDINRMAGIDSLLNADPTAWIESVFVDPTLTFRIGLVTNQDEKSPQAIVRSWNPDWTEPAQTELALSWPADIYSLSHVALPFAPDDPVYGGAPSGSERESHIRLGDVALRGEKGVLHVAAADQLRLRWNPFYSYLEQRVLEFMAFANPVREAAQ